MTPDDGYARLGRLIEALRPVLPISQWYYNPTSPGESKKAWPSFADKAAFLERAKFYHDKKLAQWPGYPDGFSALLTSASDEKAFRQGRGRSTLSFHPDDGRIQLQVIKPDEAWPSISPSVWAKDIVRAVVIEEWIEFANVDVSQSPRLDGDRGSDYFSIDYRTFPHRQFLGWMGFIQRLPPKALIKSEDVPQAAEVIAMPGRVGTLIVSVAEKFDVHNPYHIKQAQQVEMRLVDLDALPVVDPSFG